jgi:ADP-dependent NAD(P)H-hydrate dehydratase / NAD(P)H-hydrate epimerase
MGWPKKERDMQEERARASLPGWLDGLYDPDEMRAADRFAMERRGILELELAEKAGVGLAAAAAEVAGGGPIRVVVGPGNNGGDGLISARLLREAGHEVDVIAPIALDGLAGVPRTNLDRLPGAPPRPFDPAALAGSGAIVDALLGTGFEGAVREPLAGVIAAINAADAPVVAADVPSGVNASTGEVEGPAIHASLTTTNHAPKIGLYVTPGARCAGEVRVVDIGIPRGAPEAGLVGLISRRVLRLVPARYAALRDTVLVVGGARGSTGAPAMAAEAAMRAGTCFVRAAVPASSAPFMDLRLPGALIHGLEEEDGRHVESGARTIADLAAEAGAIVLGPGLGGAEGAFSRAVASSTEVPMIIEAGGLSAYSSAESFSELPGPAVLIPDEAGLGRLLELSVEQVGARRLASARALADRAGAVVVLEGNGCVVAAPGGPVALGPAASGALATNGTGSVLAGLVGTLLARKMDPFAAAAAAVIARSDAGDVAATRVGVGHTLAGDVIQALPEALAPLRD